MKLEINWKTYRALHGLTLEKKPIVREHSENQKALRADLLIRSFWSPLETAAVDICVTDTEAKSYRNPEVVLESCADENRRKYSEACQEKHIAFTLLIFSVDGMMARESKVFLRRFSSLFQNPKTRFQMGQTLQHFHDVAQTELEFCHPKCLKSAHKRN